MENINKYLEAQGGHFAVEQERYGGSYRAIVCHRSACEFIFDALEGDDIEATQMQSFFWSNALFPSATSSSLQEAISNLDAKLAVMYSFEQCTGVYKWKAKANFELKAAYDQAEGEEPIFYDVSWLDIINDLFCGSPFYYDKAEDEATPTHRRNLHALLNFDYSGQFKDLK